MFVGALLLVDIFTLSVWTGVDSLTRKLQNGTIEVKHEREWSKEILTNITKFANGVRDDGLTSF